MLTSVDCAKDLELLWRGCGSIREVDCPTQRRTDEVVADRVERDDEGVDVLAAPAGGLEV